MRAKERLARDGEVEPDDLYREFFDKLTGPQQDAEGDGFSFSDLVFSHDAETTMLASFTWGGSSLSIEAVELKATWFVFIASNDFPTLILDVLDHIDPESATGVVQRICRAGRYVNELLPDIVETGDLVDEARVMSLFYDPR